MTTLLGLHLLVAAACAVLGRRWGSRVFLLAALAPAGAFGWLVAAAPAVLDGDERRESWTWAPTLGLDVPLHLDGLALLLALLVTGVGTAVFLYAVRYFAAREEGLGRVAGTLVAFAAAMLGLVLADNVLALYVAWELTTLCSFFLIADDGRAAEGRRAAVRALLVTTGAGFALLFGLLLLADAAGSYELSAIVADPPTGAPAGAAALLILVGALAKSAQLPFHPWLPAAMVAPTPVSAYLHAAAMVKAGVYLIARLTPALAEQMPWRPVVLTVGAATMLLGGWRALAQTDLKRLLAFGTIAQLGFLIVLLGAGTRTAALAGATLLLAHALFKSTLFLVVGVIDHERGTRDLRELSGVGRASPWLAVAAGVASASMVGLPPTVGYLGKEAAFEAFLEPSPGGLWVLAALVAGSVLTAAYTLRFLWGAFATRPGVAGDAEGISLAWSAPVLVLAALGVVVGSAPRLPGALSGAYADGYATEAPTYSLALWHGLGVPVLLSLLTLAAGAVVHVGRDRLLPRPMAITGRTWSALTAQDRVAERLTVGATAVTRSTQVGALPIYLLVTLSALVVGPGIVLVSQVGPPEAVRWGDTPAQAVLVIAVVLVVPAVIAARARLTAVLLVSAVGYLVSALFVVHGAPDLALAQVLVETLTLLLFVVVLRRMPVDVRPSLPSARALRAVVAVLVGAVAAGASLAAGARHRPSMSTEPFFEQAPEAGGPNVVNVVLTEFRALDTLGEVTVLALAATGVASLFLVSGRGGAAPRHPRDDRTATRPGASGRAGRARPW